MVKRICPFCSCEVEEIKVVVYYLNTHIRTVVGVGSYWCSHCRRYLRRALAKHYSGKGRFGKDPNHDGRCGNDANHNGHNNGFFDRRWLAREKKVNPNIRSFKKEHWTTQRSRPPQMPRCKDIRQERVRDYFGWRLHEWFSEESMFFNPQEFISSLQD